MEDAEVINNAQFLSLNISGSILYATIVTIILVLLIFLIVKHISKSLRNTSAERDCTSCQILQNKDLFYLCVIMGICLIVVFSFVFYSNQEAINLFSFASTLTSIILSVIAIFMSINGEKTQELHRNQIQLTAAKLEDTRLKLDGNIGILNQRLDKLDVNLQKALDNTDTLITRSKKIVSDDKTRTENSYEENSFNN